MCDGHEQDKSEEPFYRKSKSLRVAFFTIAEQVAGEAHNMTVNPRMAVRMCTELTAMLALMQIKVNSRYIK